MDDRRVQHAPRLDPVNEAIAVDKAFPQVWLAEFGNNAPGSGKPAQSRSGGEQFLDRRAA